VTSSNQPEPDANFEHGVSGYTNHKCRCEVCTVAWNSYMVQYRKENGVRINARRRARRRLQAGEGEWEVLLAEEYRRGGLTQ